MGVEEDCARLDQLFGVRRKISEGILGQMGTKIGRVFGGLD